MPTLDEAAPGILAALAAQYGRPEPAGPLGVHDPFEAILAVALGRSVVPRTVAAALEALRAAGLLHPHALAEADPARVAGALEAGGTRLAPKVQGPIRRLARWLVESHDGSAASLADLSTTQLREELRALNGVGPPTADAILLLALGRASYPVDRASYRIAARHGWLDSSADYDEARALLERLAPESPAGLALASQWLERVGRDFCRATVARCDRCPMRPFLPEGGPLDPGP